MKNIADIKTSEISVRGKFIKVPAIRINDLNVVIRGKAIRIASIESESWLDSNKLGSPELIIEALRHRRAPIDLFRFSQRLPETKPKFDYPFEWQDVAAIPITTYKDWWENHASQVTRKNVRRSIKRGIEVRPLEFNDLLVNSIVAINNDTSYRTGRRFWHYGKDFDAVKKDYSAHLERSEFLGAFFGDEVIGFIRLIYLGGLTSIMQLLSKKSHYDKRPTNALIAKAVESCVSRGDKFLIYGQFIYDDYGESPVTEFKRRNGFERCLVPTYYVPLSLKGKCAIRMNLHTGIKHWIPKGIKRIFRKVRASLYGLHSRNSSNQNIE